ncbi:N-acetyltransferase [Rhizocola hellebori]|uniref:N-acetyltransferase n=1 Tax=Rhizocola hellebori TaxID=1392758 RepID=A0A8J3QAN8_9ACTN|nr:GNAT family N-acetyltransferase [Rhizocola hellebori]GIH06277.1 N-acetyltransferase [Rhizocola hellebori]
MPLIRRAGLDDTEQIAANHVRSWQAAYAHALPSDFLAALDPADWALRRREMLARRIPPAEVFVAEADGRVIGHAAVGRFRDEDNIAQDGIGEVMAIYVAPEHWSTGAGLALMQTSVKHLVEQGLTEIRLWVIADNPRARGFYERFGFLLDGNSRMQPIGSGYEHLPPIKHVRYTLYR